jgi:hypothetical protein
MPVAGCFSSRSLSIIGVHELAPWVRKDHLAIDPEEPGEGSVHALELAGRPRHDEYIDRELEEPFVVDHRARGRILRRRHAVRVLTAMSPGVTRGGMFGRLDPRPVAHDAADLQPSVEFHEIGGLTHGDPATVGDAEHREGVSGGCGDGGR